MSSAPAERDIERSTEALQSGRAENGAVAKFNSAAGPTGDWGCRATHAVRSVWPSTAAHNAHCSSVCV